MKAISKGASSSTALYSTSRIRSTKSNNGPQHPPPVQTSPPTTIELRGIPIHFPFKPYACQEDYMGKVLDALLRSENALLESPTGTGKTLCLLCAALAWQREEVRRLNENRLGNGNGSITNITAMDGSINPDMKNAPSRRVPTIVYASRTHSQLSQVVRELRNTRYRPKHAVLGSREQMCVNPQVKRANATGADINHDCSRLALERKCKYRIKLEGFTAPSNETGGGGTPFYGTQPVRDMEDLVSMGQTHKICPFYYTRDLIEDAELILVPYNYLFDKDSRTSTLSEVPWNNTVVIFDEAHNLESFASESASFDLTTTDIAGCLAEIQRAVNYMQAFGSVDDGKTSVKAENIAKLKTIFLKLEEYIMNSLNQQTSAYRGEFMMELFHKGAGINHANHELFTNEIRKLTDIFLQFGGSGGAGNSANSRGGAPKLEHFVRCVKRVFGEPTEARCLAKAQSYRVHITPKQAMKPTYGAQVGGGGGNDKAVGRTISYWCFAPSEAMRELERLKVRSILVTSGTLSPLESYALELDLPFPHRLENPHIIPDDQIHVRVVGKGVSNKLLTSSYDRRQDAEYYTELVNTLVSLAKVIPGGMLVFFPSYGVMEACMERWGGPASSSSFQTGKGSKPTASFFAARKRRPTGSARYSFPHAPHTFSSTNEVLTSWKRLLGVKSVVVEPKSTSDLPDAISEFHKYLNMPKSKGVILFGVCRGKISEGIDFAHDMCRAVVITGLPFAPSFDPKVRMKREFLDQNWSAKNHKASTDGGFGVQEQGTNQCLSGHEWYTQQAHRAVNQAIGRVIRNKDDYGAVLLLDNRFSLPANQQGLSKWVRPHILPDEGMGRTIGGLVSFYKQAAAKAEKRASMPQTVPPTNPVSIILKYEDDEPTVSKENRGGKSDEAEFTKIAIVDKTSIEEDQTTSKAGTQSPSKNYINPEKVIARVDTTTDEGYERARRVIEGSGADPKSELIPNPSTPTANPEKKPSVPVTQSAVRTKSSRTEPSLTPAQRFFQHVQAQMTPEEQSTIKKAAVAMKPLTDPKFRQEFLRAAADIIRIILKYETFESRSRDDIPEMLTLLMQLLPSHFRRDVRKWTMAMVFDGSHFSRTLKQAVPDKEFGTIRAETVKVLVSVWFKNSETEEYLAPAVYLAYLEKRLTSLPTNEAQHALAGILKVIPTELHASTSALFDQMRAMMQISKLRAKEKASLGENSIQIERFRRAVVKDEVDPNVGEVEEASASSAHEFNSSGGCTNVGNKVQGTMGTTASSSKRPNPYKAKSSQSQEMETPRETDRPTKVRRGVLASIMSHGSETKDSAQTQAMKKVLRESESDTFTGSLNRTRTVKSNAPAKLLCKICESHCPQLLIADCNHMACNKCWFTWLEKSSTCPVCRGPAKKESLALVVFRKE